MCLRSACGAAESKQKVRLFKRIFFSSLFDFGIWELIIGIDRRCIPFQVVTGYQGDANSQRNKSGQQPGAKGPGKLLKSGRRDETDWIKANCRCKSNQNSN